MRLSFRIILVLLLGTCQVDGFAMTQGAANIDSSAAQIELYLGHLEEGMHSPELYANLAYLFYQKGDIAKAVLHYERSLKLAPESTQTRASLAQVKSELPIKITKIPDFFLWRIYTGTMNVMTSKAWSIVQLILFFLILVFLYKWLFVKPYSKGFINGTILGTLIVLMLLSFLFTNAKLHEEIGGKAAVSMVHQEVYKAADERSETIVSIGPGNKVYILDTIGEWYKVQLEDRDIGWIKSQGLSTI